MYPASVWCLDCVRPQELPTNTPARCILNIDNSGQCKRNYPHHNGGRFLKRSYVTKSTVTPVFTMSHCCCTGTKASVNRSGKRSATFFRERSTWNASCFYSSSWCLPPCGAIHNHASRIRRYMRLRSRRGLLSTRTLGQTASISPALSWLYTWMTVPVLKGNENWLSHCALPLEKLVLGNP